MRPIKFRGRVLENHFADAGKMVFGYFVRGGNKTPYILVDNPNNNGQSLYQVDEDSVAQLVGYDRNGREVYEGDTLIDQNGQKYTISDVIEVELFCGGVYEPLYSTRYKFTLKEETP